MSNLPRCAFILFSTILLQVSIGGCADDADMTADTADTGGGDAAGDSSSQEDLRVFVTAAEYTPGTGIAGADAHCMADANRPADGVYKALIAGTTRGICADADCASGPSPVDWVLAAASSYVLAPDGVELFETDSDALIAWPIAVVLTPGGVNQFSGFDRDWTLRPDFHCDDWTSTTGDAGVGWTHSLDSAFLQGGSVGCDASRPLVCVEQ